MKVVRSSQILEMFLRYIQHNNELTVWCEKKSGVKNDFKNFVQGTERTVWKLAGERVWGIRFLFGGY